jgi:hypothetical protein
MNYSKKNNLYFNNEKELSWIKNIKNTVGQNYTSEQLKVKKWKKKLNIYFNNSILDKRISGLNEKLYEPQKKVKINLNISSFLKINTENIQHWKKDILLKVHKLLTENFLIKSEVISVQFIGSLGSFNPIEYSDFDCVIILPNRNLLKKSTYFEIKKIIYRLRYYLYSFDPYQHHDIFILTEDELINGIKPFYPLTLLKNKWGYGRDYFMTQENNLTPSNQIDYITNNQFFRRLYFEKSKNISFYNYKYILSSAFMIPVYFFNFNNNYFSKSKSIELINKQDSTIKDDFKLISELRSTWPKIRKKSIRNLTLKLGFKLFSKYKILKFYRRLEFYFPRKESTNFAKLNDIRLVIAKSKSISDYFLKKLIDHKNK